MPPVSRYKNPIVARQAAAYLTAHGIVARAVPIDDAYNAGSSVEVFSSAQVPLARSLLGKFDLLKPEYLQPLEDQAIPDLTKLPPSLIPTCPACAATLPLNAMISGCPACGTPVNVVDRIVELHGPEALEGCYLVEPDGNLGDLTDEQINNVDFRCLSCQYALAGLPIEGACPECGQPFNKRRMLDEGVLGWSGPVEFETSLSKLTDEQIARMPLHCPSCRYLLSDLPVLGKCPECGTLYHKRELLN